MEFANDKANPLIHISNCPQGNHEKSITLKNDLNQFVLAATTSDMVLLIPKPLLRESTEARAWEPVQQPTKEKCDNRRI